MKACFDQESCMSIIVHKTLIFRPLQWVDYKFEVVHWGNYENYNRKIKIMVNDI